MKVVRAETWLCRREASYFDRKRTVGAPMPWDVVVLPPDHGRGVFEHGGVPCRPVGEGGGGLSPRDHPSRGARTGVHDREAVWHEYWTVDRHLTFFPVYLRARWTWPSGSLRLSGRGCLSTSTWEDTGSACLCTPAACSTMRRRTTSGEGTFYRDRGIRAYKAHPGGPWQKDMEIHQALRDALGKDVTLFSTPWRSIPSMRP